MLDWIRLVPFFLAALVLLILPGPAVLYIVGRSLDQGRRAGLVSVLSVEAGNSLHVLAAALGLSAILLSAPTAFSVVKYLGAAYLAYLGIRRLLTVGSASRPEGFTGQSLRQVFSQGLAVAVLNPKTALFFLAFLPQFVDPETGSVPGQFLTLGLCFVGMAIVTDSLYALLAAGLGRWIKDSPWYRRIDRYLIGCIYIGLGVTAAFAHGARPQ